jgi:riboflavin biosynthesis pyrimidine reductase
MADELVVVGQFGQSIDARIATDTGHSHFINGAAGLAHLHRLRALVDAVVVGVGTALADDPQLTVRRVAGPCPARVVMGSGRASVSLPLIARVDEAMRAPMRAHVLGEEVLLDCDLTSQRIPVGVAKMSR